NAPQPFLSGLWGFSYPSLWLCLVKERSCMTPPNESPVASLFTLATALTPHESGRHRFEVAAAVLYPAMLDLIESDAQPLLDWAAREPIEHRDYARRLVNIRRRPAAIADARLPLDD